MDGVGTPVELHTKLTLLFSEIIRLLGSSTISGRTEKKKKKKENKCSLVTFNYKYGFALLLLLLLLLLVVVVFFFSLFLVKVLMAGQRNETDSSLSHPGKKVYSKTFQVLPKIKVVIISKKKRLSQTLSQYFS